MWSRYWFKVLAPIIMGLSLHGHSQMDKVPEVYGGVGYYRHTGFDDNAYYHLRLGSELFSYKFMAPEVDFTYYFGGNNRVGERDDQTGLPSSRLFRNFRGSVWGLAPKFYYGDGESRLVLIPKYHFGSVSSEGLVDALDGQSPTLETNSKLSFWSFSIGIEDEFDFERFKIGLYLTYTGFNAGKSINKISFPSYGFGNSDIETSTLGLNLRIGYSLWESRNNNH